MAKNWHDVHGFTVELRTLADGVYDVLHGTDVIGGVTFTRVDGRPHWYCKAGCYDAVKLPSVLAHVVADHAQLSHRPLLSPSGIVGDASLVAMTTYLRLTGRHADPTMDQALRHVSGRAW